jgi:hypothetical protein
MTDELKTLREILELRIRSGERLFQAQLDAASKALKIQTNVYNERLDHLNNKSAEQARIQAAYLPRETYEADKRMIMILSVGVLMSLLTSLIAVLISFWK